MGLFWSPATILEEVAEQCGGAFLEKAAFHDEGMIEAGIGRGILGGAGGSGVGVRGRGEVGRGTAFVGGGRAHRGRV